MFDVGKKTLRILLAYLPALIFTISYFSFQYWSSGAYYTVAPFDALPSIIIFFVLLIGFSLIIYKLVKDHHKAGVILLITAELLLFSRQFFIITGILFCAAIILWAGITLLRKKKFNFEHLTLFLILLGIGLLVSIRHVAKIPWSLYLAQITQRDETVTSLIIPSPPPDIYFIVVDGYARSDVLSELYGYDNSAFINYLVANDFIIPGNSHSNYAKTALSLASTLNMQYIQTLFPGAEKWPFWWLMSPYIKNSQVRTLLEAGGYQTITVAVDWDITNIDNADIYMKPYPFQFNYYERLLFQTSPISIVSPAVDDFILVGSYSSHRRIINYSFDALSEIPHLEGPKLTFIHIPSPHPPFVFDKGGHPVEPSYNFSFKDGNDFPGSRAQYRLGYVDQLQYINIQLEKAIGSILADSQNPPIIILISDHGSGMLTDNASSADSCIRERFSNFAAFHLPGMDKTLIPPDISSVNIFRIIFNHYFGTELSMLENEHYFHADPVYIYRYEDVASRLDLVCDLSP